MSYKIKNTAFANGNTFMQVMKVVSDEKSLPLSFSWDFMSLMVEIEKVNDKFVKANRNLFITFGVKTEGEMYKMPAEGEKGFSKKKKKDFLDAHEKLMKIDTKLTCKRPVLNKKELVKSGAKISAGSLFVLKDFITLNDK